MRLPDWLFARLERVYLAESRRRKAEARTALDEQDRRVRAFYAALLAAHEAGACGGPSSGCCYVPCVPPVGWGIR
jgi:hypothetical protein